MKRFLSFFDKTCFTKKYPVPIKIIVVNSSAPFSLKNRMKLTLSTWVRFQYQVIEYNTWISERYLHWKWLKQDKTYKRNASFVLRLKKEVKNGYEKYTVDSVKLTTPVWLK